MITSPPLSLSLRSSLFWRYARVARGLPLGGCMDITAAVVSVDNRFLLLHVKVSKSIVTTEPCVLTCPALSPYGRSFNKDLHTAAGP